jgi:hypothetical protein
MLKQLAVSKIAEQLDPIEQIRQDLLNGVNWWNSKKEN